jgi:protein transport protein SEC24
LFLAPSKFIDIASISAVVNETGGSIFFHPRFEQIRDGSLLKGQLRRVLKRMQGYDCMMRVRCSKGVFISFPPIAPFFSLDELTLTIFP